ncbi:hypothetical protein EEB18_000450 [Sphingopyxis sp. OPL5]|uniref:OmpH family outer membrane protein n=1 Tax=Sphingopyxis sp. OPL5 TaxID=2486273 RepID=UPI00164E432F|nr:OmpH family outer membrane protein [Sphingopyxis sp. OPL5]QNO27510.1 hypothetical protein EEB18_000450 [Sphingopyxis sp. OPL5]
MSIEFSIAAALEAASRKILRAYFSPIERLLELLAPSLHRRFPKTFGPFLPPSVDERIAHIDTARQSLTSALSALNEMKEEATQRKSDLEALLENLKSVKFEHQSEAQKLESIRRMKAEEISGFQEMAGIGSKNVERIIGFVGGIFASLIATALWVFFSRAFS